MRRRRVYTRRLLPIPRRPLWRRRVTFVIVADVIVGIVTAAPRQHARGERDGLEELSALENRHRRSDIFSLAAQDLERLKKDQHTLRNSSGHNRTSVIPS